VLITSRNRLSALAGAMFVELGVLPADTAIELLTRIVGTDRGRRARCRRRDHPGVRVVAAGHPHRRLGLLRPPHFPAWVAASAMEAHLDDTERVLEDLIDVSLVDIDGVDRLGLIRHRLHDLADGWLHQARHWRNAAPRQWTEMGSELFRHELCTPWLRCTRHSVTPKPHNG
jgi:hypothetical protein